MHSRVTLLSVFATFIAVTISQKCYGLDGTQLDDTYAPCNPNAKHSGCCATNKASGADLCLDNGLCMSTAATAVGMLWQNGCTDSTGKDVACPSICPTSEYIPKVQRNQRLCINSDQQLHRSQPSPRMEYPTMRLRSILLSGHQRSRKLLQQRRRTESHQPCNRRTVTTNRDASPCVTYRTTDTHRCSIANCQLHNRLYELLQESKTPNSRRRWYRRWSLRCDYHRSGGRLGVDV